MTEEDVKFKDLSLAGKIIGILMVPLLYLFAFYIFLLKIFNKKKFEDIVAISKGEEPPNAVKFPEYPGDDASEEEMDAYYQAEFDAGEAWAKKHRVKLFFMEVFSKVILVPIFHVVWFFQERKMRREV